MKTWLGALGRAGVEFLLALLLVGLAGALVSSLGMKTLETMPIIRGVLSNMFSYLPVAGLIALFLSYFTVEFRVERRWAGLLAILLIALLPLAAFSYLERLPLARDLRSPQPSVQLQPSPPAAGLTADEGQTLVWVRAWEGSTALNAVGADFSAPAPRLRYAQRAAYHADRGSLSLGTASLPAAVEPIQAIELVPEAAALAPWWIWSRLGAMGSAPLVSVLATLIGFGILAAAFRVFARMTAWPLANAFLAAAALVGLLIVDALMSTPEALRFVTALNGRLRIGLPAGLTLAAVEGGLGLFIALIDLVAAPGRGRGADA